MAKCVIPGLLSALSTENLKWGGNLQNLGGIYPSLKLVYLGQTSTKWSSVLI